MSPEEEARRFSDKELKRLAARLDSHVAEFRQHVADEEERLKVIKEQEEANRLLHKQILATLADNTACLKHQRRETAAMVHAWNDMQGAIRVAGAAARVVKWIAGLSFLAGAIAWLSRHFAH